jgi:cyclopropane fatty-acyl-phospholipid synthase-like methyltransferase
VIESAVGGSCHFFEEFADFMGPAYLRYSFTKGTMNEVSFLWDALEMQPGMRLLDVGCGPGRHALEFAARGVRVVGVDISQTFVDLGVASAKEQQLDVAFVVADARALSLDPQFVGTFDRVISLCQGGFGLVGRSIDGSADGSVLAEMAGALKPGGLIALSAFSVYFQLRYLEPGDAFDAATSVNTETTEIRNESGERKSVELFTTCFTPLELRLLADRSELHVRDVWSVTPGAYGRYALTTDRPEFLLIGQRK